jgi:hypothetical protein
MARLRSSSHPLEEVVLLLVLVLVLETGRTGFHRMFLRSFLNWSGRRRSASWLAGPALGNQARKSFEDEDDDEKEH